MNIMSTLGEEVNKVDSENGDDFDEEHETDADGSSVGTRSSGENKVIVRMRGDRKCMSRPQSDETSRVRSV